jgi:hypothetical protein
LRLTSAGIEGVGARVEVGKDRHRLLVEDSDDGSHVGDAGHDDLVARLQAERGHRDVHRGRAGRAGMRVLQGVLLAELVEKRRRLRSLPVE